MQRATKVNSVYKNLLHIKKRLAVTRVVTLLCAVVLLLLGSQNTARATTYYWDGNGTTAGAGATPTGTWGGASASAYWTTDSTGQSATSTTGPGASDVADFAAYLSTGTATGSYTVTLGAAESVYSLVISAGSTTTTTAGGTPTFAASASADTLTIGAGGVTMNGSSGDPSFAASLSIILGASQTWTTNNAHVIAVNSAVAGSATAGNTSTWTLGYVGQYTPTIVGVVSDGTAGGNLALTVNNLSTTPSVGGGTYSITGTANTYTGKTTIAAGTVQVAKLAVAGSASSFGAATSTNSIIDLGSGTYYATLIYSGSTTSTTDRVLNLAGTTDTVTLTNNSSGSNTETLNGNITNNIAGAKTLVLNGTNTGANTIGGTIVDSTAGGALTLTKTGTGQWALNAANTYSGGTNINGGTLTVGTSGTLGASVAGNNITISGGFLALNAATNYGVGTQTITVNSGGIGVAYTPTSGTLPAITDNTGATGGVFGIDYTGTGGVTSEASGSLYNGNWFLGSFTTGTYTGTTLGAGNGSTYRIGGGGGSLTLMNSILVGGNSLILGGTGGGTVTLANADTYTGTTTLQNGTVNVSSVGNSGTTSSSLGSGNSTLTIGSGSNAVALNYTGAGETTDRNLVLAGTTGAVSFTNSGTGDIVFSGTTSITGTGAKAFTFGASTDTYGGSLGGINDGSASTVTKNGLTDSRWALTSASNYSGITTINGGVFQTSAATDIANSYLYLNGGSATSIAVYQSNGTIARTLSTSNTGTGTSVRFPAFSGFAAYGGSLTVTLNSGAALSWGSGGFLGTGTSPLVFGSSTANNVATITNAINLNTADVFSRVIYVDKGVGGDSGVLSGVISDNYGSAIPIAATGITKQGKGTLLLSNGGNSYAGATVISQGTLVAGANVAAGLGGTTGAFGSGAGTYDGTSQTTAAASLITLGDANTGASANPTLLIGGAFTIARKVSMTDQGTNNIYAIGGSSDANAIFSGAITFGNTASTTTNTFSVTQVATTGTDTLTISGGLTGAASTYTKTLSFANVGAVAVTTNAIANGAGGGNVAVVQTGSGTTLFSVANTYTGGTTVSAGTIEVAGTGTLGAGNVTVGNGGKIKLDTNTTIADSATLTLANGSLVNLAFSSGNEVVNTLVIGGTTFNYGITFNAADNYNGYSNYFASSGGGLQVVPEPGSVAMIGAIGGLLSLRRRRATQST